MELWPSQKLSDQSLAKSKWIFWELEVVLVTTFFLERFFVSLWTFLTVWEKSPQFNLYWRITWE